MKKPFKKNFSKKKKTTPPNFPTSPSLENLRLNKFMAHCGIGTRRECEALIREGLVMVNDEVIKEAAYRVQKEDVIKYDGKILEIDKEYIYVLLNKPKGYLPVFEIVEGEKTFQNIFGNRIKVAIAPIGEVMPSFMGLLLFTDDGVLIEKLKQADKSLKSIYHLILSEPISDEEFKKLQDELTQNEPNIESISYVKGESKKDLGVEVKNMSDKELEKYFDAKGIKIEKVDRVALADLTKKDLPRGRYRFLTEKEIIFLKHFG